MEAWWEVGSAGRMEAWWEIGFAGRMEAWWEIGFAGRMAPQAPGGVADWCCGCDIRRSAEAPKRRSAEAPDRQHSGAPTGDHLPGRSHLLFAPHSVAPTSSNGLCGSRIGSRAWGHGWEIGSAGRMEAWWEVGFAGRMEAWWEIGFAGRMAPQAPGGVADWCCGCDIRRSAEAPKRRTASIAGLPLETSYLGAST